MDLSFLTQYIDVIIVEICLCVGYIIKTSFDKIPNKYIPLILGILGLVLKVVMCFSTGITEEVILSGLFSGLASTGIYEAFRNIVNEKK